MVSGLQWTVAISTVVLMALGVAVLALWRRTKRLQQQLNAHSRLRELSTIDSGDDQPPPLQLIPAVTALGTAANWLSRQIDRHSAAAVGLAGGTIAAVTAVLITGDDPNHDTAQPPQPTVTSPASASPSSAAPSPQPASRGLATTAPTPATTTSAHSTTASALTPDTTLSIPSTLTAAGADASIAVTADPSANIHTLSIARPSRHCDTDIPVEPANQHLCHSLPRAAASP